MNVISAIPFTLSSFAAGTKRVLRKACALAVRTKQIVIKASQPPTHTHAKIQPRNILLTSSQVFFWIKEHPMATVSTIFGFTFYLVILATPAGFGSDSLGAGEVVKGWPRHTYVFS